ncbi:synapse differentiation-inducing gene protein 1-like [Heteronotia binoei]|uniref:synapse differentiation-inducing gene protein 1-like n=1 Tax=Heteronotia binoei TaxID=13085 RepID=UPI00292E95FE|nr:synapse differentiation-inducing gene protein 1-like [Heteronotia binoei]
MPKPEARSALQQSGGLLPCPALPKLSVQGRPQGGLGRGKQGVVRVPPPGVCWGCPPACVQSVSQPSPRAVAEPAAAERRMEPSQRSVPSYLALSIFNLLCCCLPLGIAALIYSLRVENATSVGDMNRATSSSRTARTLNIVGIVLGVICIIFIIVIYVVVLSKRP